MLTPDEVRAVPLFASLSDADVDRLVRSSEDIQLHPGEYAVHEGGNRLPFPPNNVPSRTGKRHPLPLRQAGSTHVRARQCLSCRHRPTYWSPMVLQHSGRAGRRLEAGR